MMTLKSSDIKRIVVDWNNKYPLDRWFREKYSIPINSDKHRSLNVLDIRFEYEEDVIYRDVRRQETEKQTEKYVRGTGNWLAPREGQIEMNQQEVDELFDNVDISEL